MSDDNGQDLQAPVLPGPGGSDYERYLFRSCLHSSWDRPG